MQRGYREVLRKIQEVKIHVNQKVAGWQGKAKACMARSLEYCPDPSLREGLTLAKLYLDRASGMESDLFNQKIIVRDLLTVLDTMEKIVAHRAKRSEEKRSRAQQTQGGPPPSVSGKDPQPVVTFLERSQPKEQDE